MEQELGTYEYSESQRERFHTHSLIDEWHAAYPLIFDHQDAETARNQNDANMRNHFFEWLTAVILYQTHGYLSLVEQYEFSNHKRQRDLLLRLVPENVFDLVIDHKVRRAQCPDLLVYAPDFSDWFFCEAKGPTDRVSKAQLRFFEDLEKASGRPVRVVRFKSASRQSRRRTLPDQKDRYHERGLRLKEVEGIIEVHYEESKDAWKKRLS